MMTRTDYLKDLRDCLIRRQPYKGSEIEGIIQRIPREWRCMVGLHYPEFMEDLGRNYFEPGEPGWACGVCLYGEGYGENCYPLRIRLSIWVYESRFGEGLANAQWALQLWRAKRKGQFCYKHQTLTDVYPCDPCEWEAAVP